MRTRRQIIEQSTVKYPNAGHTNKSLKKANSNLKTINDFPIMKDI